MAVIRELGDHEHIFFTEGGYVQNDSTQNNMKLMDLMYQSKRGLVAAVCGAPRSGKSAFLARFLKEKTEIKPGIIEASAFENASYEVINEIMRSAYTVRFEEEVKIAEGEVQAIGSGKLTLKTVDMESTFDYGARIGAELERERVAVGDIIKIYKDTGFVIKQGHAADQRNTLGPGFTRVVAVPEGECYKTEKAVSFHTLYEIDLINDSENGENRQFSEERVSKGVQSEVDAQLCKWLREGRATTSKGVVIIQNADSLSQNSIEFLMSYRTEEYCPMIIFLGTQFSHDLKKKAFVVELDPREKDEASEILERRAEYLNVSVDNKSMEKLCEIEKEFGIGYAIQILQICAAGKALDAEGISKAHKAFPCFKQFLNKE